MPIVNLNIEYNELVALFRGGTDTSVLSNLLEEPFEDFVSFTSPSSITFVRNEGIVTGLQHLTYILSVEDGVNHKLFIPTEEVNVAQSLTFNYVNRSELEVGDIVFFTDTYSPTTQLSDIFNYGIFIGGNDVVTFSIKRGGADIERLTPNDFIWRFREEDNEIEEVEEVIEEDLEVDESVIEDSELPEDNSQNVDFS